MSKKFTDRFELISKFLDSDTVDFKVLKKIKDVQDLPLKSFKFLTDDDAQLIEELFKVETIGDLIRLEQEEPFKDLIRLKVSKTKTLQILKNNPELESKVKKAITISLIIVRIKKETIDTKKQEQKIIVVGLGNAGKTAILTKFGGKFGIKDLARLKPTRGLDRQRIETKELTLSVFDFGGQATYRDKYIKEPEKYFLGVDLALLVIDVQDVDKYDEAIEYFDSIIEVIDRLEVRPFFMVFLHKYDPDIRDDTEVQLNIELLQDLIKTLFQGKNLDYEVYLSSIFSLISKEPQFAKYLKDFMKDEAFIESSGGDKMDQLNDIVEKSMVLMVQLSESMMKQFSEMEERIIALESGKKVAAKPDLSHPPTAPTPISTNVPPPPPGPPSSLKPPPSPQQGGGSARSAVFSELKGLFAKRRALNE